MPLHRIRCAVGRALLWFIEAEQNRLRKNTAELWALVDQKWIAHARSMSLGKCHEIFGGAISLWDTVSPAAAEVIRQRVRACL